MPVFRQRIERDSRSAPLWTSVRRSLCKAPKALLPCEVSAFVGASRGLRCAGPPLHGLVRPLLSFLASPAADDAWDDFGCFLVCLSKCMCVCVCVTRCMCSSVPVLQQLNDVPADLASA